MKNLVGILMLGIGLTAGLFGQTASLSGTVSDPSGAVIPSAVVTVVNTETGLQREDKSDSQGRYTMDALPPGTYDVRVQYGSISALVRDVPVARGEVAQPEINLNSGLILLFDRVFGFVDQQV